MITFKQAVEDVGIRTEHLQDAKTNGSHFEVRVSNRIGYKTDQLLSFIVKNAGDVREVNFQFCNHNGFIEFLFKDATVKNYYPLADDVRLTICMYCTMLMRGLLKAITERSAPPTPSKLEERFNKLSKYWETLDLKDAKLTEYGKGIDDVVGYLTAPDDASVNTYLDTIKSESVEKKKYRVEVERGIRYVIEVEASSKDEAENLAVDKVAPMKPLKDDSNWYDCGLEDLVIFSEEVKE